MFRGKMEQDCGSECSSGGESGWTLYLEHSMCPCEKSKNDNGDDMSMVSDASSGPPHVHQQQQEEHTKGGDGNGSGGVNGWKRQKIVKESSLHGNIEDLPCFLHDTATSPFFNFSYVGRNQAWVEEADNSTFQDEFGVFNSPVSATQLQRKTIKDAPAATITHGHGIKE